MIFFALAHFAKSASKHATDVPEKYWPNSFLFDIFVCITSKIKLVKLNIEF